MYDPAWEKFSRQIAMPGFGLDGQQSLRSASVCVVGVGGLGNAAATYLCTMGVGKITLVDFDTVERTNLPRQPLYTPGDIGRKKVEVAGKRLNELVPDVSLRLKCVRLSSRNAREIISGSDIVVDCTDNIETRYIINDTCVQLKIPFVYAALFRSMAQLSSFNTMLPNGQRSKDYRAVFPEVRDDFTGENCQDSAILGAIPGIVGAMQALETLKILSNASNILAGKLLIFDFQTMEIKIFR